MQQKVLKIHPDDNVLVALTDLVKGQVVQWKEEVILLPGDVPAKHKLSIGRLETGDPVYLYGVLVGRVTQPVETGGWLHTGNLRHDAAEYDYHGSHFVWQAPDVSRYQDRHFKGYHRKDGRVGTANYWLFIPTVFCENRNLDVIKDALLNELGYGITDKYKRFARQLVEAYQKGSSLSAVNLSPAWDSRSERVFPNVDGIKFLKHEGGCGGTRQDAGMLGKLLAAYANHPNVGGITILSLGCQHLQTRELQDEILKLDPAFEKPLYVFEQQQSISEEDLVSTAIRKTFEGLVEINQQTRQPAPLSKLCIGVKCGGSDGFSGISANPAVGHCADLLVALGGQVLLAEFPELCGAEQDLVDRSVDEATARKFMRLMKSYDALAHQSGSGFFMNPSPGNIRDGLVTDAIKSTGAAKKGGNSPVVDVLDYTEPVRKPGLSLVCTPGNDVEATTGKAASGATLILFTTGLGTPTGNPVCPTIKLSTNTALAQRMPDIIDIDTGSIITGTKSIAQVGEEILEYCIRAASGEVIPKAVQLGQDDFIPWKRGVSL